MVQPKEMLKQMIEFNRISFENAFANLTILQEQMEKTVGLVIDQTGGIPEEGKKSIKECMAMYRKGLDDFKKLADSHFEKMEAFFMRA